jgi:uncharacterized protein
MPSPTIEQRLATRERPTRRAVMYQAWTDLLFLHWRVDASWVQSTLPAGLHVDCFEGVAYVGLVPFFMRRIRPRWFPPMPWLSSFLETNVRVYVHDDRGIPGVWFYSLDCNQPIAVEIARRFFHLPYQHARMKAVRGGDRAIDYRLRRRDRRVVNEATFQYRIEGPVRQALPGTLEFFLAERYYLYASTPRGLARGQVAHSPYPLQGVDDLQADIEVLRWGGVPVDGRWDHAMGSHGVDVRVYPLESVEHR